MIPQSIPNSFPESSAMILSPSQINLPPLGLDPLYYRDWSFLSLSNLYATLPKLFSDVDFSDNSSDFPMKQPNEESIEMDICPKMRIFQIIRMLRKTREKSGTRARSDSTNTTLGREEENKVVVRSRHSSPTLQNLLCPPEPKLCRHPFTPEEDEKIMKLVSEKGTKCWATNLHLFPGRTRKQLHERWANLRSGPVINKNWSDEEDEKLLKYAEIYGNSWRKISFLLPGKTQTMIKNRYHQKLKYLKATKRTRNRHDEDLNERDH